MLWAKLKTNNGRRGPTAGVVLAGKFQYCYIIQTPALEIQNTVGVTL